MISNIVDVISSRWDLLLVPICLAFLVVWLGTFLWKREP